MPIDISAQIERWRTLLLDTTKRNRLINCKTGRGGAILLVHPDPGKIWLNLVGKSVSLTFPWKRQLLDLPPDLEESEEARQATSSDVLSGGTVLEQCCRSPRLRPTHALTELSDSQLRTRLTRLDLNARESWTERGVTTLYVAFGFLRWYESSDSQEEIRAPLLLVPVRMQRESVDSPWCLEAEEDEILPNNTLIHLMASDFKLRLPTIEDAQFDLEDPNCRISYFSEVQERIRNQHRWEVLDKVAVGTFNFQKLVMWEDLGKNQGRIKNHPICRGIGGDRSVTHDPPSDLPGEQELDEKTHPQQTYHILDADSSQHAAIVAATRGVDMVLNGPPGTGKSQTIANIIAEFLAAGKTVLFVSEKAAALEVVKNRLDKKRLGDFCLELHSHKANKRDVIAELGRCLELVRENNPDPSDQLSQLFEDRRRLNEYVRQLHVIRQPLGMSAYRIQGELATLKSQLTSTSRCPIPQVLERDAGYLGRVAALLSRLEDCASVIENHDQHPWRGCRAQVYSLTLPEKVEDHFQQLAERVPHAGNAARLLAKLGLCSQDPTVHEWLSALEVARLVVDLKRFPESWRDARHRQSFRKAISSVQKELQAAAEGHSELKHRLQSWAFKPDAADVVWQVKEYRSKWARLRRFISWLIWRRYRIPKLYVNEIPATAALMADMEHLAIYHNHKNNLHKLNERWKADLLKKVNGDPDWQGTVNNLNRFERIGSDRLSPKLIEWMGVAENRRKMVEVVRRNEAVRVSIADSWSFLTSLFDPDEEIFKGIRLNHSRLSELPAWLLKRVQEAHRIQEWIQFFEIRQEISLEGVETILSEVFQGRLKLPETSHAFRARFSHLWLDAVHERVPALRQFETGKHEQLIERFRKLDRLAIDSAVGRIRNCLLNRRNQPTAPNDNAPASSELGILRREVHKKRRHLPLRKLFADIPALLLRLKPCLMMSPLAVSTYLQSQDLEFDLVIFDEASQVRPHDAICAIYRGRQLVVAGDQKQLPPTNFFERTLDDGDEANDDEDSATNTDDYESILDICSSLFLPPHPLRWHYRSRREALIAFSNHHFYSNALVTFPSPEDTPDNPAITFDYLADGRWKPGASGGFNVPEARRIAEMVLDHFRDHPEESLGVIAFNLRHQIRILDELERLRRANPDLEDYFDEERDEPFFVKNLENVQGDERDVIFLSVAYGPDEYGKIAMQFGPLNQQGGERRLNVAITRSRMRMTVVSSLRAQDIDLSRTNAIGVRLLRAYLDYAERGPQALRAGITEDSARVFDSPFEREVAEVLERKGLPVHRQVGCGGYRIDLAIVDPQAPGRYLLGVECDGATYHSSATARDRDRLRQEVLEGLGWSICRIWSTDWIRNPAIQADRVLEAFQRAKSSSNVPKRAESSLPVTNSAKAPLPRMATQPNEQYASIHEVPDDKLRDAMLGVLRRYGATETEDFLLAVARQLGFRRKGARIRERILEALEALVRTTQIVRMADQRLTLSPHVRSANS